MTTMSGKRTTKPTPGGGHKPSPSLYKSQRLAEYVQTDQFSRVHPEIWPICIPSYNRPKPKILDSVYEDLPLVFFVRKEQIPQYRYLRKRFRVIPITGVSNIGQTRAKIVKWAHVKGYNNIFMLDDDISSVDYMYPDMTKGGNLCMRASRLNAGLPLKGLNPIAFRMWQAYIDALDPETTITAPLYRPDSWHMKYANAAPQYNSGSVIQCIHLNIENLYNANLQYESSDIVGNEDLALQFRVMEAGLKTAVITDLEYDCPPINSHPGGCENASGYSDPSERYEKYCSLFFENVSGENHPGVGLKISRAGFKSIKLNWKYWRNSNADRS